LQVGVTGCVRPCLPGLTQVHHDPGRAVLLQNLRRALLETPTLLDCRDRGLTSTANERIPTSAHCIAREAPLDSPVNGRSGTVRRERLIVQIYTTCPPSTASDCGSIRLRTWGRGDRLEGRSILADRERWLTPRVYTTGSASMTLGCREQVLR